MAIVSFRHKLIFVKTAKTAGTSIEIDLSQRVEEDAIVTPIFPAAPGHRARNWQDADGQPRFWNHMSAAEIRDRLGAAVFDEMRCICVEREPVEKCISYFHMLRNSPDHAPGYDLDWAGFVAAGDFPINLDIISEQHGTGRHLLVTDVLRYDRLDRDLPALLAAQGIADFQLTARAKSGYSAQRLIAPDEVTADQRAQIYAAFHETLALTGIDWSAAT
ncbi:MAG: hypothetical protein QNJ09_01860 [Paracoccaceae bacterium]|nr:hypothetical protein [Paracoccaceae bacterium]